MTDDVERRPERDDWERDVDEARPASPWAWLCYGIGTAADRRNQVLFLAWTFAWMLGFTAAAQTLKGNLSGLGLEVEGTAAWVVAVLPNLLAVGAVLAYVRFLRMADELTRLVNLQGLAVGWGATVVFLFNWELLEAAGAPPLDAGDALMVAVFAWAFSQLYFGWRYR